MRRVAIVAGEVSGDLLGARLMRALREYWPDITFEGIGGSEMQAEGLQSLYPMEKLSVMGFAEVVSRLFELLGIRNKLYLRWRTTPPDLFVGIDAPDFNLSLEKRLHHSDIPAVHYVSPSVWAWRQGRVKKMIGNLDLMLTLFPFEVDFYRRHGIPAAFVGHPLADEISLETNKQVARQKLGLPQSGFMLALLPGSRQGEIRRLAPDFLEAAKLLQDQHPEWQIVVPLVNDAIRETFNEIKKQCAPELSLVQIDGRSRQVMAAADQILMASGTAVLEGMLINRPMVAAYRVAPLTARLIRLFRMIKSPFYTLPNNLANEQLVPELIQEEVTPGAIVKAVEHQYAENDSARCYREQRFSELHQQLRKNASERAAEEIVTFLNRRDRQGLNV